MEAIKVEAKSEDSSPPPDVLKTPMVSSQLGKQLNNKFYDLCLVVGNQKFYAHRAVFAGRATKFEASFEPAKAMQTLQIDDIEPVIFFELLRFIYDGEFPDFEPHGIRELLIAARKMGVGDLELLCERRLAEKASMGEDAFVLESMVERIFGDSFEKKENESFSECADS